MKKIMFNDKFGLTQAVLEGRKTMTRRLVPQSILDKVVQYQEEYHAGTLDAITEQEAILNMVTGERMSKTVYQVGEEVAVAQSYKTLGLAPVMFDELAGWNNKMFVKSYWIERYGHRIRITDIKVERLQDISEEDCLKEGIVAGELKHEHPKEFVRTPMPYGCFLPFSFIGADTDYYCAKDAFAALIDKVSGKGTWERNPFVFAYTFVGETK